LREGGKTIAAGIISKILENDDSELGFNKSTKIKEKSEGAKPEG